MENINIDDYFKKSELVPTIVYDLKTKAVVMLAYMNRESLAKTLETGYTWFWSRSRQELWNKGATSGNLQKVISIYGDCDKDTLLVNVEQSGVACHTGEYSCFLIKFTKENYIMSNVFDGLYQIVSQRKETFEEGSYTCYLFSKGEDKILKKCGEECAEMIIAAKTMIMKS